MTAHYIPFFNRDVPNREKEPGKGQSLTFFPRRPVSITEIPEALKVPSSTGKPSGLSHVHLKAQLDWLRPILHRADGLSTTSCVTPQSSHQVNPGNLEKISLIHEKKKISARFAKYEQNLSHKVSSVSVQRDKTVEKSRSGEGSIVGSLDGVRQTSHSRRQPQSHR
ncbi:hypothetical protein GB937_009906 [Aspergillus fischeri]|nr:hypothetical protein GB937_009906 [Aspergillus fischeri]